MSVIKRGFSALGKLGIIIVIAIAFLVGLLGTIYYSLLSREVNVPNIVGKDILEGERALDQDGLNMRKRAERYSPNAKPNTILDQSPHAGEIIKVGQTVAVVVSRASAKEGEEGVPGSSEENFAAEDKNTNGGSTASTPNNENSNKANKNSRNKNTNNSNNANNSNVNRNANANNANNRNARDRNANDRNANDGNVNSNRETINSNRNTNSGVPNANRVGSNANSDSNRRAPALAAPSSGQNRNRRVP